MSVTTDCIRQLENELDARIITYEEKFKIQELTRRYAACSREDIELANEGLADYRRLLDTEDRA